MVKYSDSLTVLGPMSLTVSCDWWLPNWPGTPITFTGRLVDSGGLPLPNVEVSINEKDFLGQLVPIKDSRGQNVIGVTDARGEYKLTDDDGWPDGGIKTVWAHAYDGGIDVVSSALSVTVIALPWWWPIPAVLAIVGIIGLGGLWLVAELRTRGVTEAVRAAVSPVYETYRVARYGPEEKPEEKPRD